MSMADHVILLRAGRIEQEGTPAALYAKPASPFAARFIGTPAMNLVRLATVQPGGASDLVLGIRPEDIRLLADGAGISAQVTSAEYHGADTIVTARVGGEQLPVRPAGGVKLAPGSHGRLG